MLSALVYRPVLQLLLYNRSYEILVYVVFSRIHAVFGPTLELWAASSDITTAGASALCV